MAAYVIIQLIHKAFATFIICSVFIPYERGNATMGIVSTRQLIQYFIIKKKYC